MWIKQPPDRVGTSDMNCSYMMGPFALSGFYAGDETPDNRDCGEPPRGEREEVTQHFGSFTNSDIRGHSIRPTLRSDPDGWRTRTRIQARHAAREFAAGQPGQHGRAKYHCLAHGASAIRSWLAGGEHCYRRRWAHHPDPARDRTSLSIGGQLVHFRPQLALQGSGEPYPKMRRCA